MFECVWTFCEIGAWRVKVYFSCEAGILVWFSWLSKWFDNEAFEIGDSVLLGNHWSNGNAPIAIFMD